jgi:transposase-like protein
MTTKKTAANYLREVRERAVRLMLDGAGEHGSQWAAIGSIAAKIGCTAETLRRWVRQAERDRGKRAGPTTEERDRIKALERENRELRQANGKRGDEAVLPARALNVLGHPGVGGFGLTLWIALTTTRMASGIAGSRF